MNNYIFEVTSQDFVDIVVKGSEKLPVIVDFWAPWCAPCKQLTPIIEKAVNSFSGKVILAKINIDENQSIASQMQIQSIPMVYAFFNGQVVDGFQGNERDIIAISAVRSGGSYHVLSEVLHMIE